MSGTFLAHLSSIASRMRHDLKGGLLTLKMGLESLDDDDALKPLLLDKAEELVELSDKLILLLRMGETKRCDVRLASLGQHLQMEIAGKYPELDFEFDASEAERKLNLDPDALSYAVSELAQNASSAGATTLRVGAEFLASDEIRFSFSNDGEVATDVDLEKCRQFGYSGWSRNGLGLSIVEGFAASHQGRMDLQERDGRFVVTVDVPVAGKGE